MDAVPTHAANARAPAIEKLRTGIKFACWGTVGASGGCRVTLAKQAEEILATWREIERALQVAEPGSAEAERLADDAALLRDEYQRLVQQAMAEDRPVPPQFPEPSNA